VTVDLVDGRSHFIGPERGAYFDCAYRGLTPRAAAEAAALSEIAWDVPWAPGHTEELRSALLDVIADIVGLTGEDIALVPSASYGMGLARGIARLQSSDQVLVLEMEHPAAALPWYAQCRIAGAKVRTVAMSCSNLTDATLAAMNSSVKIVSIPEVHWMDGTPIELSEISRRAKEIGALLVIDATQSVGGRPFKIPEFAPDIVMFSGYKWLFGPIGIAYLYLSPALRSVAPFEHSWVSYAGLNSQMFAADGLLHYPAQPLEGMRRFDASGLHNPLALRMALTGASLVRQVGPERILAHNASIISRIESEFPRYLRNVNMRRHFCGMRLPDARRGAQFLAEHSIYTSARGAYLRISPNIWNNESDIEALIAELRCLTTS
jgi:selenocysteine lyase/cysteine desulfurase